jgi:hypothetical protein
VPDDRTQCRRPGLVAHLADARLTTTRSSRRQRPPAGAVFLYSSAPLSRTGGGTPCTSPMSRRIARASVRTRRRRTTLGQEQDRRAGLRAPGADGAALGAARYRRRAGRRQERQRGDRVPLRGAGRRRPARREGLSLHGHAPLRRRFHVPRGPAAPEEPPRPRDRAEVAGRPGVRLLSLGVGRVRHAGDAVRERLRRAAAGALERQHHRHGVRRRRGRAGAAAQQTSASSRRRRARCSSA